MDPLLKQRLVGTAVLVGLAVIFVPMILSGPVDHEPRPQSTGIPLALPTVEQPVSATQTPRREPETTPAPTPRETTPAPTPRETPSARAAAPADEGWAVQLGSFSAEDNAEALARKVRERGFDAFVQDVEVASGAMYRVRVGPTPDRDAATELAARVQRATGERTVVVPHP